MKRIYFIILTACSISHLAHSQNWIFKDLSSQNISQVNSLYFTSASNGYLLANHQSVDFGSTNYIMRTTNGGNTWNSVLTTSEIEFTDIHFFDANNGIVCGSDKLIPESSIYVCRTNDAGATWDCERLPYTHHPNRLFFVDDAIGYIVGTGNYGMFETIDGGLSWNKIGFPILPYHILSIDFVSPMKGIIVGTEGGGYNGEVYMTENGGDSWFQTYTDDVKFTAVSFQDDMTGVMVGDKLQQYTNFYKTNDGGSSWQLKTTSPVIKNITDLFFVDNQHGYAIGNGDILTGGIIIQTFDGGDNWGLSYISPNLNITYSKFHHNKFNHRLYVAASSGYLYMDNVVSGSTSVLELNEITVYPNPTSGQINIEMSGNAASKLEIINGFGQVVQTENLSLGNQTFDISNLNAGTYFLRFADENGLSRLSKLIVLK